ncbi:MAG: GntR family transcriptional regulator [Anabaena sp. CoA2_C59]|jgi:GntR family transcriptional regulator|uniref:GntR family transcriptional regulator n=2 Tax=Aphanizomenon flos-aquae TaxID=1176 RepID=A0A1B7X1E4_APHFL|nr:MULTISPECIES: GntR family transcriptional regulator [Aphanizomenon]MBD1219552.1 GntR family transcriptional regulator [Aphanizomenon flos-aquae Clear-A1]MCE2907151.1 GntR family transcriptional regulator [Anabaena sp. CoA2_C59]MDJ0506964.1 GntR family transcriptional regulator [Nostocales cyanobacterium LE14-WE12]NTW19784.1 GntR family transcriptional regulator [Nostocales cyanobacterium W4_Combined_metabat2_030]OBQ20649.1 MAG: GntR family transcriptional regulator [Anabaena sp. WA113]OBQ4
MIQFRIQADSEIPASNQLFNQIRFAIASGQYSPGYKLPSTRALAMQTGLHRNTISKVYRQLEVEGFVESLAGSGIYVRSQGHEGGNRSQSPIFKQHPNSYKIVQQAIDELLNQGCSLNLARELFLAEVDWRSRCSARVLVVTPYQDIGAGELMVDELGESLQVPVQLVPMEQLMAVLDQTTSATLVTSRYFIGEVEAMAALKAVRVIPLDIHDYGKELTVVKGLPKSSCIGVISPSSGILRATEVILHGLRGDELLVITAQPKDAYKLQAMVKRSEIIFCTDQISYCTAQATIQTLSEDLIRTPKLIRCENYIGIQSINLLQRELGLI